jgi:hypothetical protein
MVLMVLMVQLERLAQRDLKVTRGIRVTRVQLELVVR